MKIAAANTDRADFQQHVFVADGWGIDIAQFDAVLFGRVVDDGGFGHGRFYSADGDIAVSVNLFANES